MPRPIYARPTGIPGKALVFVSLTDIISNVATVAFTTQHKPVTEVPGFFGTMKTLIAKEVLGSDAKPIVVSTVGDLAGKANLVNLLNSVSASPRTGAIWTVPGAARVQNFKEQPIGRELLSYVEALRGNPIVYANATRKIVDDLTAGYDNFEGRLTLGDNVAPETVNPFRLRQYWAPAAATAKPYLEWTTPLPRDWQPNDLSIISPWSLFSTAFAIMCARYDATKLTHAYLPGQEAVALGFDTRFKPLADDTWFRMLALKFRGMGLAWLTQASILTARIKRARWEKAKMTRQLNIQRVSNAVIERIDRDFEAICSLPTHPLTDMLARGLTTQIVVTTNDMPDMPADLMPYGTDPQAMAEARKPTGLYGGGAGVNNGYDAIAMSAASAFSIPEVVEWNAAQGITGKGAVSHVSYVAAQTRAIVAAQKEMRDFATHAQWGRSLAAEVTGFGQSGADFILTDGESWSGNLGDAIFGLRPVIGMNNLKLMGWDTQFESDFGVGANHKLDVSFITVDAPVSYSAGGAIVERKFLPTSAVMERQHGPDVGQPVYTRNAPADSALQTAVAWFERMMPKGVVRSDYRVKTTGLSNKDADIHPTSWDPYIDANATSLDNVPGISERISETNLMELESCRDTILIRGEYRMRVPVRLARATLVLVEDPHLEVITRSYDQRGTVIFGDEDPPMGTRGDKVAADLIKNAADDSAQPIHVEPMA